MSKQSDDLSKRVGMVRIKVKGIIIIMVTLYSKYQADVLKRPASSAR